MIHVYYGDGKGKTTAAIGQAIRAAGRSMKVFVVRFLKTDDSGEIEILKNMPGITVYPCLKNFGFTFRMTEEQKREAKNYYSSLFNEITMKENINKYDMIIMDEINVVCYYNFIEKAALISFLDDVNNKEIILTGRNASYQVIEKADYVTELKKIKHPYDQGIEARRGIEY